MMDTFWVKTKKYWSYKCLVHEAEFECKNTLKTNTKKETKLTLGTSVIVIYF